LINVQDIKNMYEIWLGKTIADKYDFKVKYKLDVKTVFMSNHRNIIVPLDQWDNQPKEFYVGVKVDYGDTNFHNLHRVISKNLEELNFLEREGREISQMIERNMQVSAEKKNQIKSVIEQLQNKIMTTYIFNDKIDSQVLGYCPRKSKEWVNDPYSSICRENPCMRVHISLLEPVGNLLEILASK